MAHNAYGQKLYIGAEIIIKYSRYLKLDTFFSVYCLICDESQRVFDIIILFFRLGFGTAGNIWTFLMKGFVPVLITCYILSLI